MKLFKISTLLLLLVITFFLSSCTIVMNTLTNEEMTYEQTLSNKIIITTQTKLEKKFTEVGIITTTQQSIEDAKETIRQKAAEYGGDAVIDFQISVRRQFIIILVFPIPIDSYICRGRIVRFI